MRRKLTWAVGLGVLWAVAACGPGGGAKSPAGGTGTAPAHPLVVGHWTYYGSSQALPADVHDVSADEGGNVYVAGGDALYAKGKADERFQRFDAGNAGLTRNCNDPEYMTTDFPPTPFTLCPVISVAGAAPGKVFVGLQGFGIEAELRNGAAWAIHTGGADVVEFDASTSTAHRDRHVFVASPPHVVCGTNGEAFVSSCTPPTDPWWSNGRRLFRQVMRIVVNHDRASPMYGDAWMGGNHATFAALLANAQARGYRDPAAGWGPDWADASNVWEHVHPAIYGIMGEFLVGETHALSIDPRNGQVWGSNGIRTAYVTGYGADLSNPQWWMGPITYDPTAATTADRYKSYYDVWPDSGDPWSGPTNDWVRSVSHCMDGTLWIGSLTHGLARIDPSGALSHVPFPDASFGSSVSAVACDPSDGSVWIGLGAGGVVRLQNGAFQRVNVDGAPAFTGQPIASIQVDRWSGGARVLYFAFGAAKDAAGRMVQGGGVAAYDGP
jgi:hypothetical protein